MLGLFWVLTIIGVLGIVLVSSEPEHHAQGQSITETPPTNQQTASSEEKPKKEEGKRSRWAEYKEKIENNEKVITATSTVFIAAFTVVLAFATGYLYFATRDLVEGADKNSEKQMRAYIGVIRGAIQPHQLPDGVNITAQVTLKNSGQTPAYSHRTWIAIRVEEESTFKYEFPESITALAGSIIGPTIESDMMIGFNMSQNDFQAVLDGRKRLFVWGIVTYRDAFDHERFLKFRSANGIWTFDRWPIGPYGEGYEAN
jgi:hypothetical protein